MALSRLDSLMNLIIGLCGLKLVRRAILFEVIAYLKLIRGLGIRKFHLGIILLVSVIKGGGGGGVQPKFYVKLDFEIAVDQKGGTYDRTFEGVPNSQCRISRGWPRPILAEKYQIRHTRSKPSNWVLYL